MVHGLEKINNIIAAEEEALMSLSREIHSHPELGDQEFYAVQILCDYLAAKGFAVEKEIAGQKTAFIARRRGGAGEGGLHIAFCAEYDALPEIGHACGHNLIAGASVAAAVALAGTDPGVPFTVSVIGTPNEEGRGGKIDLIRAGVFEGVDLAMMFHPDYISCVDYPSLACRTFSFTFHGENAHASGNPWDGRNALDAVILTFNGINALRQQLRDDVRIHGIITDGGQAINVIPDRAAAEFCIRSMDNRYLGEVVEKVLNCARGASLATGTGLSIAETEYPYDAMLTNRVLGQIFWDSLKEVSEKEWNERKEEVGAGSTDMGNVSLVVPSIQPLVAITDREVAVHTAEFARLCGTPQAYKVMLEVGKAMALAGYKVLRNPALLERIKEEFVKRTGSVRQRE